MADAPRCPWCGEPIPRMTLDQFRMGHDPVACPRCGKDVPLTMVRHAL